MSKGSHDTIAYRLAQILVKLNQGEKLDPTELAEEFGVNLRTIQRDLRVRFAYLPLLKTNGRYHLEPAFLGKLSRKDVENFAALAGIRGLFPSLSDEFLRDLLDSRVQQAWLVKGHNYEDLSGKEGLFRELEHAILNAKRIHFSLRHAPNNKAYHDAEPYRLVNNKGVWYLAAMDAGKLKTFSLSKIEKLQVSDANFTPDQAIHEQLASDDGIWVSDKKLEVSLKVDREVAGYFKRRKLIANQVIRKELSDGSLLISASVGHINQVLPVVRYWIPYIRVISPPKVQDELEDSLRDYLTRQAS
ncbi:helix-turn-helix transcriptional regulator [Hydrogenophaga atypica]|uniref:Helix-turn-helix transcriptional regulator n=1 Tax=Hydrogenophaga atypica TaxID=249409 RepID=A0ABW2QLD7_9BURK